MEDLKELLKDIGNTFKEIILFFGLGFAVLICAVLSVISLIGGLIMLIVGNPSIGAAGIFFGIALGSLAWYCHENFSELNEEIDRNNNALKEERNKKKYEEIDALMNEIDQLGTELIRNNRIIEENKKALFGDKAKARRKAQAQVRMLEEKIKDKTEQAQKIKKTLE